MFYAKCILVRHGAMGSRAHNSEMYGLDEYAFPQFHDRHLATSCSYDKFNKCILTLASEYFCIHSPNITAK